MSSRDSGDEDDDARTGIPMTPEEVKAVQLSILDRFSARCAAVGIQFFAYYGTLLGAMRHQGYIPWDDDIDLALERHQYERVAQLDWATSGLDLLVPGTQGYPLPFMKLSDPRTRLREDVREPWQDWGGVNIDLWPLDYAPATRIGSTTRELAIRTRTTIQLAHTLRDDPARPVLRRAAHNTNKLLMGRAPLQRLNVWLDRRIARTPPSKELEACYGANWNCR